MTDEDFFKALLSDNLDFKCDCCNKMTNFPRWFNSENKEGQGCDYHYVKCEHCFWSNVPILFDSSI